MLCRSEAATGEIITRDTSVIDSERLCNLISFWKDRKHFRFSANLCKQEESSNICQFNVEGLHRDEAKHTHIHAHVKEKKEWNYIISITIIYIITIYIRINKVFLNRNISLETKEKLLTFYVILILVFDRECCLMDKVTIRKNIRGIIGGCWKYDGRWK